jgi:glycosyltransferase involved in cell wall biosynthesis
MTPKGSEEWFPRAPSAAADAEFQRVAFAASAFAPHKGGVEEVVRQLAFEERARGNDPTVLTMRWPKTLRRRECIEGIQVRRFLYRVPEGTPRRVVVAVPALPMTVAAVVFALAARRCDIVHVQCVSFGSWYAAMAAKLLRLPLVVSLHGELTMDAANVYESSAMLRRTLRWLLRDADAVTACSHDTLREAESWYGRSLGERASVVHNGVRLSEFEHAPPYGHRRPYVLGVGRLVSQKGFDVLLEAFARLLQQTAYPKDLIIAGAGPERGELEAQARRLRIQDRICFVGAVDRPVVASLFRGSDVFVLASRHEPFGIVNLEAMAAARPIVATSVGGVPEFVQDGITGMLVPPDDPDAIAAALMRLDRDPFLKSQMSRDGYERAKAFDWSVVAAGFRRVYARAQSAHSGNTARASPSAPPPDR